MENVPPPPKGLDAAVETIFNFLQEKEPPSNRRIPTHRGTNPCPRPPPPAYHENHRIIQTSAKNTIGNNRAPLFQIIPHNRGACYDGNHDHGSPLTQGTPSNRRILTHHGTNPFPRPPPPAYHENHRIIQTSAKNTIGNNRAPLSTCFETPQAPTLHMVRCENEPQNVNGYNVNFIRRTVPAVHSVPPVQVISPLQNITPVHSVPPFHAFPPGHPVPLPMGCVPVQIGNYFLSNNQVKADDKVSLKACNTAGQHDILQGKKQKAKISLHPLPEELKGIERIVWINDTVLRCYQDENSSTFWHLDSGKWVKGRSHRARNANMVLPPNYTEDVEDSQQDVECNEDDYTACDDDEDDDVSDDYVCENDDDVSSDGSEDYETKDPSNKKEYKHKGNDSARNHTKELDLGEKTSIQPSRYDKPAEKMLLPSQIHANSPMPNQKKGPIKVTPRVAQKVKERSGEKYGREYQLFTNSIPKKDMLVSTCCSKCFAIGETEISTVCKKVKKLVILCDKCYEGQIVAKKSTSDYNSQRDKVLSCELSNDHQADNIPEPLYASGKNSLCSSSSHVNEKLNVDDDNQVTIIERDFDPLIHLKKTKTKDHLSTCEISQDLQPVKDMEESSEKQFSDTRLDGMNHVMGHDIVNSEHCNAGDDLFQTTDSDIDGNTFSVDDNSNAKPQSARVKRKLDKENECATDIGTNPLKKKATQDNAPGGEICIVNEKCSKCQKVSKVEQRMQGPDDVVLSKLCLKCSEDKINKSGGHPHNTKKDKKEVQKHKIRAKSWIKVYIRELADFVQFGSLSCQLITDERKTSSIKFKCWKCQVTGTTKIYAEDATKYYVHKLCDHCFNTMKNSSNKSPDSASGINGSNETQPYEGRKIDDETVSNCSSDDDNENKDESPDDDCQSVDSVKIQDGNDSTIVSKNELFESLFNDPCDICGLNFQTFHDLIKHKWLKHKERMCPKCSKEFLTSSQLELHIKLHMCMDEEVICRFCGEKTPNLMGHLFKAHEERYCHICGMLVLKKDTYYAQPHFKNHVNFKFLMSDIHCPIYDCGFEVKSLDLFLRHMWLYHNERKCFVCKEAEFSTLEDLLCHFSQHMNSPIDVEPMLLEINDIKTLLAQQELDTDLSCQNCHLRFSNLLALSKHQWLFHSREMSGGSLIRNFKFPSELAHEKHKKNLTINKCQICCIEKGSLSELSAHLWSDHDCRQCIVCLKEVQNAEDLNKHLLEFLEEFSLRRVTKSWIKCPEISCGFRPKNFQTLLEHMWSIHSLGACPICDQKCASHKEVFYHIVMHQCEGVQNPQNWDHCTYNRCKWSADVAEKCPLCSFVSPHHKITLLHMWDEHGLRKCLLCKVPHMYQHLPQFVHHMLVHVKKRTHQYPCFFCNQKFASRQGEIEHSLQKHGVKALKRPFWCAKCKTVVRKFNCTHKKQEIGQKMAKCRKCEWVGRKALLYMHIAKRHGKKRFQCEECGLQFACKTVMRDHQRIHTGEKPYKCEQCDKSFARSDNLITHMRSHTGEKPYVCELCGKGFARGDNLKTHMKKMH